MGKQSSPPAIDDALCASILRFIAREEPLKSTFETFPQVNRETIVSWLERAANTLTGHTAPLTPPPKTASFSRIRVYSDGAARGNPGPAGAGAVLVEPSGEVVDRLGKFLGTQTNNYAEYQGLLIGLTRAIELGVKEVEVFADSELMIRQLGGRYQVKSASLRPLFEEALRLLNGFERVKLMHVPREMNRAADEMSNRAIDERL
jgi:ribonuclease HI